MTTERAVTWVLAVALLASLFGVVFFAANPPTVTEPFTEFYILGPDGSATDYPTNLSVGESGTVIVGVTNHEHEAVSYTVVMKLDNETVGERPVRLGDEETWEGEMSFTVEEPGRQRLRLELYRGEVSGEPYRSLRLWVHVT
ncbi:DUF1616 domain-containing protein [Halobellus limi]|nr:DUF1616 domain-containing protein [Halobellus limi]